jgi:hypothetical protein
MRKLMLRAIVLTSAVMFIRPMSVAAQAPPSPPPPEAGVFFERNIDINIAGPGPDANFAFMTAPIAFDNDTVSGAPYSAEAVTEVVQPLADGNRIVRQSKAQLARDGAGRTRREQSLSILGPLVNKPDDLKQIQITDPQAHTIVLLNSERRTAHKIPMPNIRVMTKMMGAVGNTIAPPPPPPPPPPPLHAPDALGVGGSTFYYAAGKAVLGTPKVETLGTQFLEGVQAEGTRTTFTIPAGQIGNDLAIDVVSERWFSPDLKVLVMSRQADPRFGETTYRLTNIVRGEPSPQLFEIPADFTVEEAGPPQRDVIIRKLSK